ncbi:Vascular endothelial growth factor receptor 3 [Balamuthia mandrillaris]
MEAVRPAWLVASAVVLVLVFVISAAGGQRVGLITTDFDPRNRADVPLRLNETGRFESVSYLNESSLPTLEELVQNYDALLVWSGLSSHRSDSQYAEIQPFPEPEVLGDLLQGYVEQGGGVVLAVAGFSGNNGLKGGFAAYSSVILPQEAGSQVSITAGGGSSRMWLGEAFLPNHPVMRNITAFNTSGVSLRSNILPSAMESKMAPGSYILATYNDGLVLVAARDEVGVSKSNRVDLNFHPVSRQTGSDYYEPGRNLGGYNRTTQGAELIANALFYSMSGCGSFAPQPLTIITCSEGRSEIITVEQGMTVEETAVPDFSNASSLHVVGTCHGPINITQSPAAGTLLAVGLHNITVQVEDALGTLAQCTTTFTFTLITVDPSSSEGEGSSSKSSASGSESDTTDLSERDSASSEDNLALILGLSLGLPLLLLLVGATIFAALFWRRVQLKKTRRMQKDLEDGGENMYQRNPIKPGKHSQNLRSGYGGDGERGMGFSWNIQFSELTFGEEIGRGGFGVVMKGKWRGTPVAIKQILAKHNDELEQMRSEMEIMQNLRPHGNVLLLLGVCEDDLHNHYVVTEFMAKGDLRHFLMSEEGEAMVNYQMMVQMAREIAVGMCHLHSEGIIHRDLAARNLLLTEEFTIKISDFGLSRLKRDTETEEQTTKSEVGPLKWMAPESISQQMYSQKSDVWSYGVVLWEIVNFGEEPYPHLSLVQAALAVVDQRATPEIPEDIPEVLQGIMKACWQYDPKDRPTMDDIVSMLSPPSK